MMNWKLLKRLTVLLLPAIVSALGSSVFGQVAQERVGDSSCDFSEFRPLSQPHSLLKSAVRSPVPEYPVSARAVSAEGEVIVRLLVSKSGNVVRACFLSGHPLLRAEAIKAAKGWKFKRNFGYSDFRPKNSYAEVDITFNFRQ